MNAFKALVPLLLLLSGATGLTYEVVLARYLTLHLGSSGASQAITLAVFLGGFSAGALLAGAFARTGLKRLGGGRSAARTALVAYGLLEAFIAVWAIGVHPMAEALFGMVGPSGLGTKLALAAVLVMPLTTAMGATLPLLAVGARFGSQRDAVDTVSKFYWVNALGGVLGTLFAGFVLIEATGLIDSVRVCACINLLIAVAALAVADRVKESESAPQAKPTKHVSSTRRVPLAAVVLAAGLTGFVTLMSEVVWTRIYSLAMGATVYAFSLMLAAVIAGISIGSALAARSIRRGRAPDRVFAFCQLGAAASALFLLWRLDAIPVDLLHIRVRLATTPEAYPVWLAAAGGLIGAHLLPAAICLGASFPALLAIISDGGTDTDRGTAWILSANTAGNLLGALAGGFVVMPLLGIGNALMAAAATSLLVGLLVAGRPRKRLGLGFGIVGLAIVGTLAFPPQLTLIFQGLFHHAPPPADTIEVGVDRMRKTQFLFHRDGKDTTISVEKLAGGLAMRNNGKPDGGSLDLSTQTGLGHAGFLLTPAAKEVLVIGLGTGQSAAAAALHGARVVSAEISAEVVEAAAWFNDYTDNMLTTGAVEVVVGDGRDILRQYPSGSLDIIVSQPPNMWVAGVGDLLTVEHFEVARDRLSEAGTLVQWVQLYETTDDIFRPVICTLHSVMANIHIVRVSASDVLLLARKTDRVVDLEAAAAHFATVDLSRLAMGDPGVPVDFDELIALEIAAPAAIAQFCRGFDEPLSLLEPFVEYRAPRLAFARSGPPRSLRTLD
ncbi:MAG: spermidine synthase, partial [Myxococcota bacterium]